ncbi:MAG: GyrI-like domain-containing protein [Armatimonas sp.]
MEPKFESLPAFVVVGAHHRGAPGNGEIPGLWQANGQRLSQLPSTQPGHFYGICDNFDMTSNEFDYVAGIASEPDAEIPEGYVRWEVPAQSYAVFSTPIAKIQDAYHYIHSTWMPTSGKTHGMGPELEHYGPDFDEDPSMPLTIWIPIQ